MIQLAGLTVTDVRTLSAEECEALTHDSSRPNVAIVFNDGSEVYALRDPEGNVMGCLMWAPAESDDHYYVQGG